MEWGVRLFRRTVARSRGIMTSSVKLDEALEKLQKNPYYEKYSQRIAQLQQTSPEEFMQRVEQADKQKEEERRKKFASVDTRQYSSVLNPKAALQSPLAAEQKKLEAIFKTELVVDKNAVEIQTIWEEYHKNKEVIAATIPATLYNHLLDTCLNHPIFLFPLPREQGYEFFMCQSSGHELHFTPLLAYQVHKENAPECLTIVHYTELMDKGIVLMRGEYDKNVLSGKEAQCLANQFQLYYSGKDEHKTKLLHEFSSTPEAFKHMNLISELENIKLA